jgi:hypothetical protein
MSLWARMTLLAVLLWLAPAAGATSYTINASHPQGLDCQTIGVWKPATSTCIVTSANLGPSDDLLILGAAVELAGPLAISFIENRGTLRINAWTSLTAFVNHGHIEIPEGINLYTDGTTNTNTASGLIEIAGQWLFLGGNLDNAGFIHVTDSGFLGSSYDPPGTVFTNGGTVLNEATVWVGYLGNHGQFFNHDRVYTSDRVNNFGFFENAGDYVYGGPLVNAGTALNLCDSTPASFSGFPAKTGLVLEIGPDEISWCSAPNVGSYDVVRGDLTALIASGGDYASSTEECIANDSPVTAVAHSVDPEPDHGFWFLVRPNAGSYDSHYPSQATSRDPGIETSGSACPS